MPTGVRVGIQKLFSRVKNVQGQVSLMVAMMMTTFILFFAFVVNVGMLVNAKINLQNAADMAAYAGAAVQARQLNDIAYLNYEMRRAYKKFLFRYYVIGNYAQKGFPSSSGSAVPHLWSPNANPANDFKAPTVCIAFNPQFNNICQTDKLGAIPIKTGSLGPDAIDATLQSQLKDLETIRMEDCKANGTLNMQTLVLWLWNTHPDLAKLTASLSSGASSNPALPAMITRMAGLAKGLGLIPKEFLYQMRINTLVYYLNFKAQKGMTTDTLASIQGEGDVHARERSILAFKSAFATLGDHTFDQTDQIQMDELLPAGMTGSSMVLLTPIKHPFDTYAVNMDPDPNAQPGKGDCVLKPSPFLTGIDVPLGFYKDPSILTYYAIRLTAKAKILFSPFGDLTMRAYSAAQPFGNRLGHPLTSKEDWSYSVGGCLGTATLNCTGNIPNLPVGEGDSAKGDSGWNKENILYNMFTKFQSQAVGGTTPGVLAEINDDARDRAYQAAMAPNPAEKGKYTIINDGGVPSGGIDPFQEVFEDKTQPGGGSLRVRGVWAPVVSPDLITSGGDADKVIEKAIQTAIGSAPPGTTDTLTALVQGMKDYVSDLRAQKGEGGESYNVAKVTDPYKIYDATQKVTLPVDLPPDILFPARDARNSYVNVRDGAIEGLGRVGYSVKYVPLKMLRNPSSVTSNGQAIWGNKLPASDGDAEDDYNGIEH